MEYWNNVCSFSNTYEYLLDIRVPLFQQLLYPLCCKNCLFHLQFKGISKIHSIGSIVAPKHLNIFSTRETPDTMLIELALSPRHLLLVKITHGNDPSPETCSQKPRVHIFTSYVNVFTRDVGDTPYTHRRSNTFPMFRDHNTET